MFSRDNPYQVTQGEVYRNIQLNYEKMRRVALSENYDAVWVVESDTIPPKDALGKLLEIDAPIVTGLYALRHGEPVPNLLSYGRSPEIGSAMKWEQIAYAIENNLTQILVSGGSMGCLLIRKPVLEKFQFVLHEARAPDVPLMEFCWKSNFIQVARLDVMCGHKKPSGVILQPQDYIQ